MTINDNLIIECLMELLMMQLKPKVILLFIGVIKLKIIKFYHISALGLNPDHVDIYSGNYLKVFYLFVVGKIK